MISRRDGLTGGEHVSASGRDYYIHATNLQAGINQNLVKYADVTVIVDRHHQFSVDSCQGS